MARNLTRADFVLIDHLQATWQRATREHLDPWLSVEREKRTFTLICEVDPTEGLYHAWLSIWRRRLWNERGFRTSVDLRQLEEVGLSQDGPIPERILIDETHLKAPARQRAF